MENIINLSPANTEPQRSDAQSIVSARASAATAQTNISATRRPQQHMRASWPKQCTALCCAAHSTRLPLRGGALHVVWATSASCVLTQQNTLNLHRKRMLTLVESSPRLSESITSHMCMDMCKQTHALNDWSNDRVFCGCVGSDDRLAKIPPDNRTLAPANDADASALVLCVCGCRRFRVCVCGCAYVALRRTGSEITHTHTHNVLYRLYARGWASSTIDFARTHSVNARTCERGGFYRRPDTTTIPMLLSMVYVWNCATHIKSPN